VRIEVGVPLLSARNVKNGVIDWTENFSFISEPDFAEISRTNWISAGDVLLTIVGTIGRSCLLRDSKRFAVQRSVAILRPDPRLLDGAYFQYSLQAPTFQQMMVRKAKGTAQQGVYLGELQEICISLPGLAEQRRIVEEIEALLSDLDAAVRTLERALEKLKRYRQAVLKAAVEGELSREWREDHRDQIESASKLLERVLAERRRRWVDAEVDRIRQGTQSPKNVRLKSKYSEPGHVPVDNLPPLPSSWPYVELDTISPFDRDALRTGPFGMALGKRDYQTEGTPIIGIENIGPGRFLPGFRKFVTAEKYVILADYSLRPRDIIVSRSGTVGQVCVIPAGVAGLMSTNLVRIRVNEKAAEPGFVALVFSGSKSLERQLSELCSGSTRDFLNHKILRRLALPLPPLTEQRFILARIEQFQSVFDSIDATLQQNLRRAARLRQSILEKAFRGELVPQDPSEEPASVLLERIRAERAAAVKSKPTRPRKDRAQQVLVK
jgi:type I restriction enzyme S subunit